MRFVAILPYPDPDSMWPKAARARFAELAAEAHSVVTLEKKLPDSKQKAGLALARRDGWLAKVADEAIVVWDGSTPLRKTANRFEDALGDEVWILDPRQL